MDLGAMVYIPGFIMTGAGRHSKVNGKGGLTHTGSMEVS
jgi:hypothetical protein